MLDLKKISKSPLFIVVFIFSILYLLLPFLYSLFIVGVSKIISGLNIGNWLKVALDALGFLYKVLLVGLFYYLGKECGRGYFSKIKWKRAALAFSLVFIITGISWVGYGTHTKGGDPVYFPGSEPPEIVHEFNSTNEARSKHALWIFIVWGLPIAIGFSRGLEEERN